MNAVLQLRSALDRLRDNRTAVARVHGAMAAFNPLHADLSRLQSVAGQVQGAISEAQTARWPDVQEVARLQAELESANNALARFKIKRREDFARADQLHAELVALTAEAKALEAAALVEHAMGAAVEAFGDVAELYVAGVVEWAACWLAVERAHGRSDSAVMSPVVKLPMPLNAPKSAALEALRAPRNLTAHIEARARELLAEIQAA